ncbi:glycine reductase, partial [Desulfovibrio sp. OttesenSCG-928-A18]|nr:glycine reductase [Desulfovibrio sp. OttesenSCG-928-A18]
MATVAVKATAYCLNYAAELGLRYGTTPHLEHEAHPDSPYLADLAKAAQSYDTVCRYAPNLTYTGAMSADELTEHPRPCQENLLDKARRFGRYGEIMPEDEFIGLMDICDVFDLVWLEKDFAARIRERLAAHPLLGEEQLKRLEQGHEAPEIMEQVETQHALPLFFEGRVVACCRRGHEVDANLSAHVLLENIASKAGAVLALMHLVKNSGLRPVDIDFVVDCSEEAAGDMNQRGG